MRTDEANLQTAARAEAERQSGGGEALCTTYKARSIAGSTDKRFGHAWLLDRTVLASLSAPATYSHQLSPLGCLTAIHPGLYRSLGWTYTIIWSLSCVTALTQPRKGRSVTIRNGFARRFYPQIWINYKRKSTTGLSMDFLCLNPIGAPPSSLCSFNARNTVDTLSPELAPEGFACLTVISSSP